MYSRTTMSCCSDSTSPSTLAGVSPETMCGSAMFLVPPPGWARATGCARCSASDTGGTPSAATCMSSAATSLPPPRRTRQGRRPGHWRGAASEQKRLYASSVLSSTWALDRLLALQLESVLDEERGRGHEVVDHGARVLHVLDRHRSTVPAARARVVWRTKSSRSATSVARRTASESDLVDAALVSHGAARSCPLALR